MCNLAGYIGRERAAPVLLKMLKRQEGFAGGYYTGIATIASGELHCAKVIGDVATLLERTNARDLPGKVGIIHSRSKSGGDREWAHPFIGCGGRTAYVANGHGGIFERQRDKHGVAQRLLDAGHTFYSKSPEPIGEYPRLEDKSSVHSSEVMCCLIESLIARHGDPALAMRRAYTSFPAEIVGLMLHTRAPDRILASRISQPLMIATGPRGTYLATTALAFPEDAGIGWISPLAINPTAEVTDGGLQVTPFNPPPGRVAMIIPWEQGFERVNGLLSEAREPVGLGALKEVTAPLWPERAAPQKDFMVYEILRSLHGREAITFRTVPVEGVLKGTSAPSKRVRLA